MKKAVYYFLASLIALSVMLMTLLLMPLPKAPLVGVGGNFIIREINIVDVVNGRIIEDATVKIEHGRIASIQTGSALVIPPDYVVIEAEGHYLAPGLWDMHTHGIKLSPQLHHPLFIRYGVTSVRDMSGCMEREDSYWACPQDRRKWENSSLAGESISPRYPLQSSYQTNGGNEVPAGYSDFFRLNSPENAGNMINFYSGQGVDFIKTYADLSAKQFAELAEASREGNFSLAGHKPMVVPLADALAADMTSIEHGRLFMFECYKEIEAFREEENPLSLYTPQKIRDIVNQQDQQQCSEHMHRMAGSETYWVPTLTTIKMSAMARDENYRNDKRLNTIPWLVRALLWEPDINRAANSGVDEQGRFVHGDYFEMASQQVGTAKAAGVKILAGTDNIDTYVFTGSSLHDELSMLVDAGFSPLQALQAATIDAAVFAGRDSDLGSVEVGKKADLIFLRDNPLLDISSSLDLAGVMFNGQYFDASALMALEQYAIDMAKSVRVNLHYLMGLLMSPLMRVQLAD
ncbi:amidohydrolase family protein [Haliea sp. AH-315-K21]|uniref:Amidohydrolase-related domain-containing protein n=1 Tax=SAR86 cluster bacterium TaxID=2030880 RepID=A0A2A5C934_9GAMM|nr:amidohydrolase family protein [Haliea sp. AH-315-K21]PCJ40337.1 MAG: hypothetical protein COA71_10780 [SAR86 cluster bacterium]